MSSITNGNTGLVIMTASMCASLIAVYALFTMVEKKEEKIETQNKVDVVPINSSTKVVNGENREKLKLSTLPAEEVPLKLQPSYYFESLGEYKDTSIPQFEHAKIFEESFDVISVLDRISKYIADWIESKTQSLSKSGWAQPPGSFTSTGLFEILSPATNNDFNPEMVIGCNVPGGKEFKLIIEKGVQVYGGTFDLRQGSIFIGEDSTIERGSTITGPTIIGKDCEIRKGAYVRAACIIGNNVSLRCEMKNSIIMDNSEFCHPGYVGDSVCGRNTHFGNQVTAANLPLLFSPEILISLPEAIYYTSMSKVGLILGDNSQLGCGSVTDPGTLLGPDTHVYPLVRIPKGFYGPNAIIKNKSLERGIVEVVPLDKNRQKRDHSSVERTGGRERAKKLDNPLRQRAPSI